MNTALKNRDGLLKKVDMPVLNGTHPFSWIARAERFFVLVVIRYKEEWR